MKRPILAAATLFLTVLLSNQAHALGFPHANHPDHSQPLFITPAIKATGWRGNTFMPPAEKAAIKATHILLRPNRRFHFYGNTVRFIHYAKLAKQNGGQ